MNPAMRDRRGPVATIAVALCLACLAGTLAAVMQQSSALSNSDYATELTVVNVAGTVHVPEKGEKNQNAVAHLIAQPNVVYAQPPPAPVQQVVQYIPGLQLLPSPVCCGPALAPPPPPPPSQTIFKGIITDKRESRRCGRSCRSCCRGRKAKKEARKVRKELRHALHKQKKVARRLRHKQEKMSEKIEFLEKNEEKIMRRLRRLKREDRAKFLRLEDQLTAAKEKSAEQVARVAQSVQAQNLQNNVALAQVGSQIQSVKRSDGNKLGNLASKVKGMSKVAGEIGKLAKMNPTAAAANIGSSLLKKGLGAAMKRF